jgi:hypothetical protein
MPAFGGGRRKRGRMTSSSQPPKSDFLALYWKALVENAKAEVALSQQKDELRELTSEWRREITVKAFAAFQTQPAKKKE